MATLKVFRTPIGFHDAYVAATSRKAALRAWGSDKDLFARGVAEIVNDPELTQAPLAEPGVVIRRSRGGMAEQIAALPPDLPKPAPPTKRTAKAPTTPRPAKPKPDRGKLDAADAAIRDVEAGHRSARTEIDARIAALGRDRDAMLHAQREELAKRVAERDTLAAAYEAAIRKWRG